MSHLELNFVFDDFEVLKGFWGLELLKVFEVFDVLKIVENLEIFEDFDILKFFEDLELVFAVFEMFEAIFAPSCSCLILFVQFLPLRL